MSTEENEGVGILSERIKNLIDRLDRFETTTLTHFVTREEFSPIKKLVYGGVALVLTSVAGALLALIFVHPFPL